MFEAGDLLELLSALSGGAGAQELATILERPGLALMFPAVGIPEHDGIAYLVAMSRSGADTDLDAVGQQVVAYFRELLGRRPDLERLVADPRTRGRQLTDSAFARTREYLPAGTDLGDVRLVLLPLGYDSRTERNTVYMDPLAAVSLGLPGIRATLAHELHHVARYRRTGENLTLMVPATLPRGNGPDAFSQWVAWLETEGVADCVSNITQSDIPFLRAGAAARRRQEDDFAALLNRSLAWFRSGRLGAPSAGAGAGEPWAAHLGVAHPVGHRLAMSIEADLGRPALVGTVGHPAAFLRRYNETSLARVHGQIEDAAIESVRS